MKEEKLLSLPLSNSIVDAEVKEHSDRKYRSVSHVELSTQMVAEFLLHGYGNSDISSFTLTINVAVCSYKPLLEGGPTLTRKKQCMEETAYPRRSKMVTE